MKKVKKEKSLSEMTKEIVAAFKNYEKTGTKPWTYETAIQDLSTQIGSLNKIILQMKGYKFPHGKSFSELKELAKDELADILADVLFTAHDLDINMEEAWQIMSLSDSDKIEKRSKKVHKPI